MGFDTLNARISCVVTDHLVTVRKCSIENATRRIGAKRGPLVQYAIMSVINAQGTARR